MLKGGSTVRMVKELVVMSIGPNNTNVTCDFWFHNDGTACTLQMGFPDEGNANEEIQPGAQPVSNFQYFKSYVDGVAVPTNLVQGQDEMGWHVKTVSFGGHADVHVKDIYSILDGSGIAVAGDLQGSCAWASYIVHTGSSWKGPIGRCEIDVTFDPQFAPQSLTAVAAKTLSNSADGRTLTLSPGQFPAAGTIVYRGVATPTIHGRTLTFVRTAFQPTEADDLNLWFDYHAMGK